MLPVNIGYTNILLLLVNVTNLEPNVFFAQRSRRIGDNVLEALLHVSERSDF